MSQPPTTSNVSLEGIQPMSLGRLLDRALKLLPGVFMKFLPFYVIICVLTVVQQAAEQSGNVGLVGVATLANFVVSFPLFFGIIFMASDRWLGKESSAMECIKRISFKLVLRSLVLGLRITLITLLGLFLLVIPGIIYAVNRILAFYILLLENASVEDSLKKSKSLMLSEKWYKASSPIMRFTGMSLLFIVIGMFALFLPALLLGAATVAEGGDSMGIVSLILFGVITLIGQLIGMYSYICYVGFYYDLRARYEGSDVMSGLESLAESR